MSLYYDLPVYRDMYKLILKIFEFTKDFSKEFKYTLGQDLKRDSLQLVGSIFKNEKLAYQLYDMQLLPLISYML